MNNIMSEKEYQRYIINELINRHHYIERNAKEYDRLFAIDRSMLFNFLEKTQPDTMDALKKIYKNATYETIVNVINSAIMQKGSSLISVLKNGVFIENKKLILLYPKPETSFNKEHNKLYNENKLSIMEEVWISDNERIDLVIFINGLAIISFELKCNFAGQSYKDAILQYRKDRDPKNRLFIFKAGCLVNFAMDLDEVYMTTKLSGSSTYFLPFNMGNGEGVNAGSGNPVFKDKYSVSYMWENILSKETIIELITRFIFIEKSEKKDRDTGKKITKEILIFPRYHQLDVIHKLLADVHENKSSKNYLIQHSAGSGKTNSIAWLAHRLSSFHDTYEKIIFDNIVIVTDRIIVDRQLQDAVRNIDHKNGLIQVMDDQCTSKDLANALSGNTKIIVTTIQKFPYIADSVRNLKNKNFAVIIDEAHSSTAGKEMAAITKSLASGIEETESVEEMIKAEIDKNGKQPNVSIFAFTATPKPTTIAMFGHTNSKGMKEAFHIYSMKQAIEEGFIVDVLQNYLEYKTYYHINKNILEDPQVKNSKTKKQIARFIALHETNIAQRVAIIVEHFRTHVINELGGFAKAMVVTASREEAVRYRLAFENYVKNHEYNDVHALVAFSGKVKLKENDTEYTESMMNGFSEKALRSKFDTDDYNVLLVANKYQTGFDQPKLYAMYIMKKLKNVSAVQTLSRLNRICPPYKKNPIVLDFVNTAEDIMKAFEPYYTTTLLANTVTPDGIYKLESKVDGYLLASPIDIEEMNNILYKSKITANDKKKINYYMAKSSKTVYSLSKEQQKECVAIIRRFIRFYEFLLQVTCFEDIELHKKYRYYDCLESYLDISESGDGFNLDGKLKATDFVQKKVKETKNVKVVSDPLVNLPVSDNVTVTEDEYRKLSSIIDEINNRMGKNFNTDVGAKAMLQIKDLMIQRPDLEISAKNNKEDDFRLSFDKEIDDVLIDGLEQNQDFFTLLLNNDELKKEVVGIFVPEIYKKLREK